MTSKKSLEIFNNFRNLADASRFGVKARVKNIIDLYNEYKNFCGAKKIKFQTLLCEFNEKYRTIGAC